jgi:hypothetical protein
MRRDCSSQPPPKKSKPLGTAKIGISLTNGILVAGHCTSSPRIKLPVLILPAAMFMKYSVSKISGPSDL